LLVAVLIALIYSLGILAIVGTILPMWRTTRWWVRVCDFPRFQIAVLAITLCGLLALLRWPPSGLDLIFIGALALAALWQLTWIWRYLPIAPLEVPRGEASPGAPERIALLTTNVLQGTHDADHLLTIISEADPDLILAVETDEWWCSRLKQDLQSRYPHCVVYPLSNGYGLTMLSRLSLIDPMIRFVVDDAIPSIKTGVQLRSGAVIDVYGVHPRPPSLGQDSIERDVELVRVGMEIKDSQRPSIVLGDLNDVAWSPTTSEFKRVGGLLDPRRGRGFFNTYPAGAPGFRYPLDYVFHSPHFAVCDMRVLPRFQSDHLPLIATLCLTPALLADGP
jgi:endonuclease/exonuclease/phosphatase (EEP) superfamily protein YafD